jgi:hypothetical protein
LFDIARAHLIMEGSAHRGKVVILPWNEDNMHLFRRQTICTTRYHNFSTWNKNIKNLLTCYQNWPVELPTRQKVVTKLYILNSFRSPKFVDHWNIDPGLSNCKLNLASWSVWVPHSKVLYLGYT